MIKLNKDTLKAKYWLTSEIEGYKLADIYGSYSNHKEKAFERCKGICKEKNGRGLCIISHNRNCFTVKFTTDEGVYIITKTNTYFIK